MARGKYVWCLGDDDYLAEGALAYLLNILHNKNYGLVHLAIHPKCHKGFVEYTNTKKYISNISYWTTFISANIVNTSFVGKIDFKKYMGTFFTLIPLYLTAAIESSHNAYINERLLCDIGKDTKTNGGYNLFEVFVKNYLSIWKCFAKKARMNFLYYEKEKKRIFVEFTIGWIYRLLFLKHEGNFKTDKAYAHLFKYYWYCPYFYIYMGLYLIKAKLRPLAYFLKIKK
jgi:hypothetical protein